MIGFIKSNSLRANNIMNFQNCLMKKRKPVYKKEEVSKFTFFLIKLKLLFGKVVLDKLSAIIN